MGPRDYLHDFMTLLSVLRNGDNRFLPLLLAKVNDVLPRLVTPMLQSVPDSPPDMCGDVDIFDGFGNAGIGVASNFPGYNGNGTSGASEFKMEPEQDFSRTNIVTMPAYDHKRIEDISSPTTNGDGSDSTPFASPSVMQSPMEYPGLGGYGGFSNINSPNIGATMNSNNHLGNFGEGVGGGRHVDYRREFDLSTLNGRRANVDGMVRRPPLRQGSGSSFGMPMPRSVPEQYGGLQRTHSGMEGVNMGMGQPGGVMPYR